MIAAMREQTPERAGSGGSEWSPGFFESLRNVDGATAATVDEMLAIIRAARRSREPRQL
jgi:hypothetical protein